MNEARLRDRIDELEEENRQLRVLLVPHILLPARWRLSRSQSIVLRALRAASPGVASVERVMAALYGFDVDCPEQKIVSVLVSHIRRKLIRVNPEFAIENVFGQGYRLTSESAAFFDAAVAAEGTSLGRARGRPRRADPSPRDHAGQGGGSCPA